MKSQKYLCALVALMIAFWSFAVFAQGQGRGRGREESEEHGKGHGNEGRKGEKRESWRGYYSEHDRDWARGWYRDHQRDLPPGLAKRDELPPGLARQLRVRGTLPPGLMRKVHPVPVEFVHYLPPPPPDCEHVLLGGNIVLLNRRTHLVLDIVALFH